MTAEFEVIAPGRVNLIGEHIDYNLLPVLPIAIDRAIRIRARAREDARVVLASPVFGAREFELAPEIPPYPAGDWGNYAKAAGQALAARRQVTRGFEGEVTGDIPIAAGLSSSSALVVACGLALLRANQAEFDRLALMDEMADAERYVGTRGGGMDQAICLAGVEDHAVLIEFAPLRLLPIPIPRGWRFVVAGSLVKAEKSAATREAYNQRVEDCRDALRRLPVRATGYPDLLARVPGAELLRMAEEHLADRPRRRFRHVVTEAARVWEARDALVSGDAARFGRLLAESHRSLRDDYQVSHPEVDRLVDLAMESGAWGARVTGAGFGGSIIAAVPADNVNRVIGDLEERFYGPRRIKGLEGGFLLAARASHGARVWP